MDTVMIIAGESSGELYGSLLARALKAKWPEVHIAGVGGEKMRDAGVELVSGIASAFGLFEAVSSYKAIKETFRKVVEAMDRLSPKVIVLIDYPDFNIKVGKIAKEKGIKILYYVSPQIWAWRKGRIKTIADISDKIAVILPFEEAIYKNAGVEAEFVGHPVLEDIEAMKHELDRDELKISAGLKANNSTIALLPGSRPHELKSLLPVMLDFVREFRKDFPEYQFIMPVAPNIDIKKYQDIISKLEYEKVVVKKDNAIKALFMSDMAVIASGTATLQAAFLETPMVIIYKLFFLTYFIGRMIVNVKHISLANIICGRTVVKELLQSEANPGNISDEIRKIISDKKYRGDMIEDFRKVKKMFKGKRPSERVAEMVYELAR